MRRAAKVDDNQAEIVKAFRAMGATVFPTHRVGQGFPDLVVGYKGKNYLVEVKDGKKFKSQRALTDDEQKFFNGWKGSIFIVESVDHCVNLLNP